LTQPDELNPFVMIFSRNDAIRIGATYTDNKKNPGSTKTSEQRRLKFNPFYLMLVMYGLMTTVIVVYKLYK